MLVELALYANQHLNLFIFIQHVVLEHFDVFAVVYKYLKNKLIPNVSYCNWVTLIALLLINTHNCV